jgi:toxin FitB
MIIADTNVISEAMKASPSATVLHWLGSQHPLQLYTTTITQAEILYGIELLPHSKRRASVRAAAEAMFMHTFADRILPFDSEAAYAFAKIAAARRKRGRPIQIKGAQIAAIALSRGAIIATRDSRDFEDSGLRIINPWTAG